MTQKDLLAAYRNDLLGVFGDPSLVLTEGHGCRVMDADGNTYLDLLGGIAVNALGHAHPRWVEAVTQQAAKMAHVSNFFTSPSQVGLARKLLEILAAPDDSKVFFANSGTEANEAALKLIRAHGNAASPNKSRVIALQDGFHGRTAGALAATWKEAYRAPFQPLPGGVEFIEPTVEALNRVMDQNVAGIILEPIQGEAGVRPLPTGFLAEARKRSTECGALLVVDEVQSGMGRTGQWLASSRELGVENPPDAVTLAKSLGGGFPIGAMVTMTSVATGVLGPGNHGTTFGGNPLATSAGLATIETIEDEGLLTNAREMGEVLRRGLEALDDVVAVRGEGLLLSMDLRDAGSVPGGLAPAVVSAARKNGFIINATGAETLRLAPPLIITEAEVREFLQALPGIIEVARSA